MSVVSVLTVVPSRIEGVFEYARLRPVSNDELRAAISPPSLLRREATMINDVLGVCADLGLLVQEDGNWRAVPGVSNRAELRNFLETVLLGPDATAAKQANVAQAVAWFLTLDPSTPLPLNENWVGRVTTDCPNSGAYDLTSEERARQFAFWAVYLGFGWRLAHGQSSMVQLDPTEAMERHLRASLEVGQRTPLAQVIQLVAGRCPVFEGGAIRDEVEQAMASSRVRQPSTLSASTSLALNRLRQRKLILLESDADADKFTLVWPDRQAYSHLTLLQAPNHV